MNESAELRTLKSLVAAIQPESLEDEVLETITEAQSSSDAGSVVAKLIALAGRIAYHKLYHDLFSDVEAWKDEDREAVATRWRRTARSCVRYKSSQQKTHQILTDAWLEIEEMVFYALLSWLICDETGKGDRLP